MHNRPEGHILSCLDFKRDNFLRFAFKDQAYQYKVTFKLSLSPLALTNVTEVALAPLKELGICILNYLDDWLILAHS